MMNTVRQLLWLTVLLILVAALAGGCKKTQDATGPNTNVPTYPVTATVYNPQGYPQGGATLTLQNPPYEDPKFSSLTDSTGHATIQSPSGQQVLLAKLGTVFQATISVNVQASSTPTVVTTPLRLVQNTSLGKVLVVLADAEQLEDVLHVLGYSAFDSISVYTLRTQADADSTGLLNQLKQYKLIFSDCNGGDEYSYPLLARIYGRFIASGGKIYGGHYNYYNLEYIWPPYFQTQDYSYYTDTLQVVDNALKGVTGTYLDFTNTDDSRHLSGYEKFTDLPPAPMSHTYGVIKGSSPQIAVIVECYPNPNPNGGKYLWTDYHNQDIKNYPALRKIVEYFLLNM